MVGHGLRIPPTYENHVKVLAPDLPERIKNGEFVLPLYADLSRLPEQERRAIFGLMVDNEGKTRIPVYDTLTRAGFDPDLDTLQVPVMHPSSYLHANFWAGMPVPLWRQWGTGGLVVDWELRTSLEGLYAAGGAVYGGGAHSSAAAGGRYAGRKAASCALTALPEVTSRATTVAVVSRCRIRHRLPLGSLDSHLTPVGKPNAPDIAAAGDVGRMRGRWGRYPSMQEPLGSPQGTDRRRPVVW